jgi:hypothetical protein
MQALPTNDHEHLKLLSLFYYIMGGLTAALSLLSLPYIGIGVAVLSGESSSLSDSSAFDPSAPPPPEGFGWFFIGMGLVLLVLFIVLAICLICSGRYLSKRTHYQFSFVIACLICLSIPLGTILGIFTIMVLSRPSVKYLYGRA